MKLARIPAGICFIFCLAQAFYAANYTVSKTADTNDGVCDADCSLREAVTTANATADNDTIYFALPLFASAQTIVLSSGEIVFANNGTLTIYGTGANRLTISGNNASRIFASSASAVVNLHHLRLTAGNGAGTVNTGRGGAVYNVGGTMTIADSILTGNSAGNGGALNNAASTNPSVPASLTMINCLVSNNSATSSGAAMQNFSTSTMNIINSSIINNTTSTTGVAGALQANGTVNISNSTVSNNSAPAGTGGGVYFNGSSMIMTNVTIVNNTSGIGAGGLHRTGTNPLNVRNTIIAGNTGAAATPDAFGAINSQGNNIIGTVGTSTGWIASDLQNQNPMLTPLGFYGGINFSHAPLMAGGTNTIGSPAINGGQNCVRDLTCATANPPVAIAADQRGAPRADTVDIGAYETNGSYRATLPSALVNQPYSQVIAPNSTGFGYSHTGGAMPDGIIVVNTTAPAAFLSGTPPRVFSYNFAVAAVEIGSQNFAVVNYQLNVLNNLSFVPVTGRVVDAGGGGVGKTTVLFTDQNGNARTALTNGFGYFYVGDLAAGATYTVTPLSKQFNFAPQTVTVTDATGDLNFKAVP
jgi:CSLREA domain-containing protein